MAFRVLATARSFCNTEGLHHEFLRQHDCITDLRAQEHALSALELSEIISGYDGAILGLDICDANVIQKADHLRVISRYGAGVDSVDINAATRRGIIVTNTPGANRIAVAELTIALLFALARQIPLVAQNARTRIWKRASGWEVTGKILGVIGFGAIGRDVATKTHALGMHVLAYDPFWIGDSPVADLVDLDALVQTADVISLHCPLTPETRNLINVERIAQMHDGAYLINTARGGLVDENALYDALQSGKLGGAALDAFVEEPPTNRKLLALENFIATPHIGGTTRESVERMSMAAAQNLVAVLHGEPCENMINPTALENR